MRDAIERKGNKLVDTEADIEENRRDDDPIDKRNRENISNMNPLGRDEILVEWSFFGLVILGEHLEEYHLLLL